MNRIEKIQYIRQQLRRGNPSVGSWMQIPHPSIAEILGQAGYDWIAVDMEHGLISPHQLPDLFRALELGDTLPLVRLAQGSPKDCKQALDAGAGGVIVPMIESVEQLEIALEACCWPPTGKRGVGFSRANFFGKNFTQYAEEAQMPLFVAQIEHIHAVENLETIIAVEGLDAIFIGPYDLSASMELTGQFEHPKFKKMMMRILQICKHYSFPAGIHIVEPNGNELNHRLIEGYQFIAYSIDAVFLHRTAEMPLETKNTE